MNSYGKKLKPLSSKPRTFTDWIPAWDLRRETPEWRAYRYFCGIDAHLSDDENEQCAPDTDEEDAWKETHEPELVAAQEAERKRVEREERHRHREATLRFEWWAVWSDESDFEEEIRKEVRVEMAAREEEQKKQAEEERRRIAEEVAKDDAEYYAELKKERKKYASYCDDESSADESSADEEELMDVDSDPEASSEEERLPSPVPIGWDEDGGNDADDEALGTFSDLEDELDPPAYDPVEHFSQSGGIGSPEWAQRPRRRIRAQQKNRASFPSLTLDTVTQTKQYITKYRESDFANSDSDEKERSSSSDAESNGTRSSVSSTQSPKRPREGDEEDAVESPRSIRRRLTPGHGDYDSSTSQVSNFP